MKFFAIIAAICSSIMVYGNSIPDAPNSDNNNLEILFKDYEVFHSDLVNFIDENYNVVDHSLERRGEGSIAAQCAAACAPLIVLPPAYGTCVVVCTDKN